MSSIIEGIREFTHKFKFNEPWKRYVPHLYSESKEPVFSFETKQPRYHELQLDQNTTLEQLNDFLQDKKEHLENKDDIYFWVDTELKYDNNYLVASTRGTTVLQGLEYPTGIYFKTNGSSDCIQVKFLWTKQSEETYSITLPDLENLHSLLIDSLLPPQDSVGSIGQLQTINHFISCHKELEMHTLQIRDLKVILNCCGYENFLEPIPMSIFYLGKVESTLLLNLGNGDTAPVAQHRSYGILLLVEKLHMISTLYILMTIAPVPSILCYVTSEKPTTLVWSLLTYMEEYSRFQIQLTPEGLQKKPLLEHRELMVTPWTLQGTMTKLSLIDLYFHSKRIKHYLDKDPEEFLNETIIQIGLYPSDKDLDHKLEITYDKCLPKHNNYLLRDCDTLMEYKSSLPDLSHFSDELLVLSILLHTALNANMKLRFYKSFYPKELELPILYYLHTAFPQITLEEEEQAIKENRTLSEFSINYHRKRPDSPPTWHSQICTNEKGEDICENYLN